MGRSRGKARFPEAEQFYVAPERQLEARRENGRRNGPANGRKGAWKRLKHGHTRIGQITPEYTAYTQARQRCTNPRHLSWPRYGARGIEFRFSSFEEFLADVGPRPTSEHSLDRIDNDGHYEPGNVRWATREEQARNTRRKAVNSE